MQRQTKHKSLLNMFQVVLLLNHPHPKTKRTLQRFYIEGCCHSNPWIHTHTHTPCFNLFWKNIVHATLKQIWGMLSQQPINAHTHTLFQFVFNKCCYGNFKTNLRDAVTATHKCTHTHTHTLFQFVFNKCCYGNFKTNLRDAVTATHKCTHTHKLYVEIVTSLLHITPKPLCWVNTFATQIQEWK